MTVEISLKSTKKLLSVRFTLPYFLHEGFHQPPSLCASDKYVLLRVNAFIVFNLYHYTIIIIKINI